MNKYNILQDSIIIFGLSLLRETVKNKNLKNIEKITEQK